MIFRPIDLGLADVIAKSTAPRTPGLHMSDLYNRLYAGLEPKRYGGEGPPNPLKLALGLAWESHLERCFIAAGLSVERPGEFTTDEGVIFSPDLLMVNGHDRMGEIKLSWMSMRSPDDPKFGKWITQMKVYGHHLQMPRQVLIPLFVNGDYKQTRDPVMPAWEIEFSAREMREEWELLKQVGRQEGLL